jgi:hypothetical protein
MRPNLVLRPPVVVLPLPSAEMTTIRTVLAQRRSLPVPTVMLPLLRPPVVIRLLKRAVKAAVTFARRRVCVVRRQVVLAVNGARPPPRNV